MNGEIILGALLHDIGKFAQRAGERLSDSDRGIEATSCPLYNGKYTHTHVLHSGKFIRKLWRDLSGIQSFIYAVASQGALKGLRGRSIYLQLLAEGIAESLLWELELNPTSLIYCSGGHFYLLAPKNSQTEKVFLNKLFEKKKPVIAKVEVEQMGNAFMMVKIKPSDKV